MLRPLNTILSSENFTVPLLLESFIFIMIGPSVISSTVPGCPLIVNGFAISKYLSDILPGGSNISS